MVTIFVALLISGFTVSAGVSIVLDLMHPIDKLSKKSGRSHPDDVALARRTMEILRDDNFRNHEQKQEET